MKKNVIKKVVKVLLEVLVLAAVVCFFVVFIMTKTSGKPLFIGGKTTMWVMTESMDPTIAPKTYILVEKVTADEVDVGDIVVFVSTDPRIAGQYNTHRIIEKNGDKIVTKGDNNPADDGVYSAQADKIVGRFVRTLPALTFLGRAVMSPVGFAAMIALFLLATVLCVMPDIRAAIAVKNKEDEDAKQAEMDRRVAEEVARMEREGVSAAELRKEKNEEKENK